MEFQGVLSEWLGQLASYLSLGYAFGAGMVSAVNPCGFAMLPVYLSLYLGIDDERTRIRPFWYRLLRALWVTVMVTCGFGVLFGIVGAVISIGGSFLGNLLPWISVAVAVLLILLGLFLLAGRYISFPFMLQLGSRIGDPRSLSLKGFFLFGVAFGATSLGCTLPVFLAVVGSSLSTGNLAGGLLQFLGYILGMGSVLLVLTLGMTFVREGVVVGAMRRFLPYVQKISAVLLLLAGGVILYHWIASGILFG